MRPAAARNATPAILLLLAAATFQANLGAQVFEVRAGSSTLFDSQGGMITMHARGFEASAGLGTVAGRLVGGGEWVKKTTRTTYTLGSENVPFNLPTDIFDNDHYLTALGAGVLTKAGQTSIFAFLGAASTTFNTPFFEGARAQEAAAIFSIRTMIAAHAAESLNLIASRHPTIIESVEWSPASKVDVALSGGVGANEPYVASSLSIMRSRFDLQAAYIQTGGAFRRVDVTTPLTAEPVRENVILTVRPLRNFTLSASRQNYLIPQPETVSGSSATSDIRSSIDQFSASLNIRGVDLSATVYDSAYEGSGDRAIAASANRKLTQRINAQMTFLESRQRNGAQTDSLLTNVEEQLSPRWTLSEISNYSNGQNTFGFGGAFLSNILTFSAEYQTYYVPQNVAAPFQQALITDAKLHVPGGIALGGGSFVAPSGKLLYTAQVDGELSREQASAHKLERIPIGATLLRGRVVDRFGTPVAGAALLVDQSPVYTDSNGYFFMRERRARSHSLSVLVGQFLDGVNYRVLSAPATMRSCEEDNAIEATIVVEALTPGTE